MHGANFCSQEAIPVGVDKSKNGERVVTVAGLDCMCGGTHVKNTQDIRAATATKIRKVNGLSRRCNRVISFPFSPLQSKKCVRVSYTIAD